MHDSTHSFTFEYPGVRIISAAGSVSELSVELEHRGLERALVVCGKNVGTTPAVVDPVREGLGGTLVDVFAETTPTKDLETALRCVERIRDLDIDVLVAVGGGSSLDTATVASALAPSPQSRADLRSKSRARGRIDLPDGTTEPLPLVAVPTTLAGADLSLAGGVSGGASNGEGRYTVRVSDPRLMPDLLVYDRELFATTPRDVLVASAMNGFDKGIDTLYSRNATPITDATASDGIRLLESGLARLGGGARDHETMQDVVNGTILVQYGVSRPDGKTLSVIHAVAHGFSRNYDVHQGVVHGIVAPHVLRYLFEQVDGRREMLATALGIVPAGMSRQGVGDEVVASVAAVRDALGLEARARTIPGLDRSDLPEIADAIVDDAFLRNGPPGLNPTSEEIERVLQRAW